MKAKLIVRRNCGFFSDFLTIMAGIMYFIDNKIKYHIDWKNDLYPTLNDENLFDIFFNQEENSDEPFDFIYSDVTPYGYYFTDMNNLKSNIDIYNFLLKPSKILNSMNILKIENLKTDMFENFNVLGVHRRSTDHFVHGEILSDSFVMNSIKTEFNKNQYDKIFITTDDSRFFDLMNNEFGDILLFNESTRSPNEIGVHFMNDINKLNLASEVVKDAYLLSKTKYKLLVNSNVSMFSNMCNLKKDNFTYIDNHINYR